MQIITISGKARHGKDTIARFLKEAIENDGYTVRIIRYGDLLKHVCKSFFGWNGKKDERGRTLLQSVGTDTVRAKDPDYWVRFVLDFLKFYPEKWDYIIIPDCRFPNEVEAPKKYGFDSLHVRVIRSNFASPLTQEQQLHPSETSLDDFPADVYILNEGDLKDLKKKVFHFEASFVSQHQITLEETTH